jgi:hypothetical protein
MPASSETADLAVGRISFHTTQRERSMKTSSALLTLVLLSGATNLYAENFKHKASGLQFTLPKGWTCTEDDDRITIQNKNKSLSVVGGVIEKAAAKAIFSDIEGFLSKLEGFKDAEVTDGPKKEKVNQLEQAWYEGTTSVEGDDGESMEIEWDMTIISGGKNILFLVGTGELDKHEEAYDEFFESIKKSKDEEEAE